MTSPADTNQSSRRALESISFLEVLRERRSRRFAAGMQMPSGPLQFKSRCLPIPLSEREEAALAFAGSGLTGYAAADLCYAKEGGGTIMAGLAARTAASGDGIQAVALAVINDVSTHLIRRPQDLSPEAVAELIELGHRGQFTEFFQKSRVRLQDGRAAPPLEPLFNINANRWSVHAPGTSYFLPINDLTFLYINGLLEIFNEHTGAFILDERAHFQPAGLARFSRSRGGHLENDPAKGRVATIQLVETLVTEFVTIEAGMMLQNLGLMAQALGLGGFPNFANHEFGWFQALGFRMGELPVSRYLGAGKMASWAMRLLGQDLPVPYPLGLERAGEVLLKAYCPPYFPNMKSAVTAVAETKFGPNGVFRGRIGHSAWKDGPTIAQGVAEISGAAIDATIAYCEYVWQRYGRFPAHMAPFRTVVGFQAAHLDPEFYSRYYRPEVLGRTQREEFSER